MGFKKHSKTKTNILVYRLYVSKMEILDTWLQILKNDGVSIFRLGPFYKYNFPVNLKNIETNLDDFIVPQRDPFEWDYYLKCFKLQDGFSDDVKNFLKSTTNMSNV